MACNVSPYRGGGMDYLGNPNSFTTTQLQELAASGDYRYFLITIDVKNDTYDTILVDAQILVGMANDKRYIVYPYGDSKNQCLQIRGKSFSVAPNTLSFISCTGLRLYGLW